jgi:serine kinase of HPr protein (carbohydrate metabolism regulator)
MAANLFHATCVVFCDRGLLLQGASGSGKSDLALRLIDAGGLLIADDYVMLDVVKGRLHAQAPKEIQGMMEVRGIGLLQLPHGLFTAVDLIIDCMPREIERLPESQHVTLHGVSVPLLALKPFEASAVAKVKAFLQYPKVES